MCLKQVTAKRGAVLLYDDCVSMHDWLAIFLRYIAGQRYELNLLIERYRRFIPLAFPTEPCEANRRERAHSLKAGGL